MKKTVYSAFAIIILALSLSVGALASNIGFRGYDIMSVSDSGYARTAFSPEISVFSGSPELKRASLPSKYDSRDKGAVTSIKDQGMYGACWAFSAISCAESSLISSYPDVFSVEETDLSEVQHAYFSYGTVKDKLDLTGDSTIIKKGNYLDIGGNIYSSTTTFAKWFGVSDEGSVTRYEDATPKTKIPASKAFDSNVARLENAYWIDTADRNTMKKMIMKYGSVSVACFYDYSLFNEKTSSLYCSADTFGNHQVTIIGWDDNYSRNNFGINTLFGNISIINRPKKNGAWLVKNSYGEAEGDNGCFWLSYYDKPLLSESGCAYEFVFPNEKENNYQYDGSVGIGSFYSVGKIYGANVFTAKKNEALKAVSFINDNNSQTYKYQIYLDPNGKSPMSGTPVYDSFRKAAVSYAGYNTVELEEKIQLKKGQRFSVVFAAINKNKAVELITDYAGDVDTTGAIKTKTTVKKGQSFVSEDGKTWDDVTKFSGGDNFRIKAITEDGYVAPTKLSAKKLSVALGTTSKLSLSTSPKFASSAATFSSSDESVATVSASGAVTAKKIGKTTITVTSKINKSVKTKVTVTVIPASPSTFVEKGATTTSVSISWSAVKGASAYQLFIEKDGEKKLIKATKSTSAKVTALKAGVKRKLFVRSYVEKDGKKYYSSFKALTVTTKPAAVKLTIKKTSSTKATLSWNAVKGAEKYVVYKLNADKKAYSVFKTIKGRTLSLSKLRGGEKFCVKAQITLSGKTYLSAASNKVVFKK